MKTREFILSAAALMALCGAPAFAQQPSTTPQGPIAQRKDNQQDRIAQGVQSGQLTAGESARLERQQQSINRQIAADRQANGGHLTGAERAAINRRQNRASENIYNKKHNGRTTRP